jgi:hypothetical protein
MIPRYLHQETRNTIINGLHYLRNMTYKNLQRGLRVKQTDLRYEEMKTNIKHLILLEKQVNPQRDQYSLLLTPN